MALRVVTDPFLGEPLLNLAVVGVGGAVAAALARRVNQPTVVGFLVVGVLLGPVAGLVQPGALLEALGGLGIALLLFLVGLDMSIEEARAVGPPALAAGAAQLLVSGVAGYVVALAVGFGHGTALFIAAALSFSSTVVVVKLLVDAGELDAPHGRLAVGVLLFQDLVVVVILTLLPVLGEGGGGAVDLARESAIALVSAAVLVAGGLFLASRVLAPLFRYAAGLTGLHLLLGLAWLFVLAAGAVALHVSVEVAAFTAGLGLARTPYADALRRSVHPLLDLFIALFFVTLGVRFALWDALEFLWPALAFSAFVLVVKPVVLTLAFGVLGYGADASVRGGVSLGQVSEFAIVLGVLGLSVGLVGEDALNFIILVAMITIAVSAALVWNADAVVRALDRAGVLGRFPRAKRHVQETRHAHRDHVLVLGWDAVGARAARAFVERGERVLVVDAHPDVPHRLPEGVSGLYAEPRNALHLEAIALEHAKLVFANIAEPGLVRVLMQHAHEDQPVIARAETTGVARLLVAEGAAAVVSEADLVARSVIAHLTRAEAMDHG